MLRNELYKPWFADKERWGFEVLSGDFQGVIIQIENIKVEEINQQSAVGVNYHVIHKPSIIENSEMKSPNFQSLIDTVINDILNEAMENYEHN